jgi:signal transduction histidine kinase
VVISLLPKSLREGQLMSGFSIEDNGIGMAPEQLARVCERFYRADTSGKIPGTGLGMSIVKEIVELHRGTVNITSKAGNGTTVTVWLPVSNV